VVATRSATENVNAEGRSISGTEESASATKGSNAGKGTLVEMPIGASDTSAKAFAR